MVTTHRLTALEAEAIVLDFIADEWSLSPRESHWLKVLKVKPIDRQLYGVEVGLEGLPDKWVIAVQMNGECDPNYRFVSPVSHSDRHEDLQHLPENLAYVIASERNSWLVLSSWLTRLYRGKHNHKKQGTQLLQYRSPKLLDRSPFSTI